MVLLHLKSASDQFQEYLYECKADSDTIEKVSCDVINIYNLRFTLKVLCDEMRRMVQSAANQEEEATNAVTTVIALLDKIDSYLKPERVSLRRKGGLSNVSELEAFMDDLRGSLLIITAQTQSPANELLQQVLMENVALQSIANYGKQMFDAHLDQLWFAAKKLVRSEHATLSKYIGSNDKTKIVIKITKQNGNMPMREPCVDEDTKKKMMAFWYKKQENEKALKEDDDDSYLYAKWADNQALKQSFLGFDPQKIQYRNASFSQI
eukprot:CAMPEP_0202727712 /NCGR_PEP_ID=MMETSP1385-20130828/185260_1 /ASSEMBLY_ACC=CAM_ASM_000861 /TAXON_ID=933848 /ORGANISM="Elphidium margaritaceum" /LENGTH=264 /DNA_ID=CAMNT_0049393955 /DNA_START=50 /DNA_END=844 /DNA_ORIENTATION=+